jgi:hypothetical protein
MADATSAGDIVSIMGDHLIIIVYAKTGQRDFILV